MRIFLFDKFLIRHLAFLYLEIKSAIFTNYSVVGKNKFLKIIYLRLIVNYIESFNFYLKKLFKKKNKINIYNKNYTIQDHGIQFLEKVNIKSLNFIKFNDRKKSSDISIHNEIDFINAEKFAKKVGFHGLVEDYLKTTECQLFVDSWNTYSYKNDEQLKTGLWHRDRDGIKLVKFFIYLTDVNSNCGGHFFVIGSHNIKPLRFVPQFRYKDMNIKKYFGQDKIIEVLGEAGTCFMEDTTGFHRGSRPLENNVRSILSFTYFTGPMVYEQNCGKINLK